MDRKSRIILWVVFLLIVSSVAVTYYRIMVRRNYLITTQVSCDPKSENCFVSVCDPQTSECSGDPEQNTSYYKIITKNARRIPECDSSGKNCLEIACDPGESECEEKLCTLENVPEGETCNNPEEYNAALSLQGEQNGCNPESDDCLPENDATSEGDSLGR